MFSVRNLWLTLVLVVLVLQLHASAQSELDELEPEIDVYYKLNSALRIWFQAKETREFSDPVSAEIGPSIDFYMKPWIKLKDVSAFDLDDSKARPLLFSIGYRYLPYPNAPPKNRLEPFFTFNLPMKGGVLISDRNRSDLDWQSGNFTWDYRNRLTLQRTFTIHGYHPSPYASVETGYVSKYEKWSDTAIYAGCLFPIGKHFQFNPYYEHQNNTGKHQQLNQLGLILNLYFWRNNP